MKKLSVRQAALLIAVVVPGGKYLSLPRNLAEQTGKDAWLVVLTCVVVDLLCLTAVLFAVRKNSKSLPLDKLLYGSVGKVVGKVVLAVLAVFFALRIVGQYGSIYALFAQTFGISANWLSFCVPLTVVALFVAMKGFPTIGRLNELLFLLVTVSLAALMIAPFGEISFDELLPFAEEGFGKIFSAAFHFGFRFADYAFLYFVLDEIDVKKRLFAPILGAYAIAAFAVVFMYVVFIGIYGDMAQYVDVAMSRVSQFGTFGGASGRLDWLFITLWALSVFLKTAVFFHCLGKCVCKIFGVNGNKGKTAIYVASSLVVLLPLLVSTEDVLKWTSDCLAYPFAFVVYVLPFLTAFSAAKSQKRRGRVEQVA